MKLCRDNQADIVSFFVSQGFVIKVCERACDLQLSTELLGDWVFRWLSTTGSE